MSERIEIVEVGPRDGLQNEKTVLTVEERVEFVRRLEAAGVRRIETVSFVNPRRVPQMVHSAEVCAALPHEDGRTRIGLVLNERGWNDAVAAGVDEANVVVCASDGFGIRNQGASVTEQMATAERIAERARAEGPPISATISVAFGDPFDGEVPRERVVSLVRDLAAAGYREIALGDTIGVADPWSTRRMVEAVRAAAPEVRFRLHFHDTRRAALANAYAGVEAGVRVLDASCGGIGGCPFAPAATGNLATEDLVYQLDRAGFETGLDLDTLIETALWIGDKLGKAPPSALSRAGGFPQAA